ncbi:MAG: Methylphosphotriester-DNA--protein-cysteine S-methyltransferase (EC / DNA-3-methyladenine glycosylase II [uncultured Solirubrobacteraceae bacterium]|uniref:DNA-3-methyladenine glycosylase II n=1 Tax=uncultured Solirubrobacteraceae bacterium TaxID=1162706 RepID=A0A6J4TI32_9ACTN|nr:MAG: Methylphosphotriester-DNA--protein-cysteine S-methyltransferase (EC / DNA-3-methyladenine glycosylase II [uncultured Solirubrobacteraceae bacterium]
MRRLIDDPEQCYRFMRSRDTRFDGRFFVGVTSTGIFCRPSCPARLPRFEHCRFHASAAAALGDGFRACKRCRPAVSPGSPEWVARTDLAARAMRLIADGVVDRGGVEALAARLGYSSRQVHRALTQELGAGPLALARAQRAQSARTLIESTGLSMTDIAFAAGFDSIRQFNDTMRAVFAVTPTELRGRARPGGAGAASTVRLRLALRTPFDAAGLFGHLAATAVPGVEEWRDGALHRALALEHGPGVVALSPDAGGVAATLRLTDHRDLTSAVARIRRLLDLDADPVAVDAALAEDPLLRPAVAARPGSRVPRCVDGAELALRIVLGQQVSTAAARTVTARLVRALGEPLPDALAQAGGGVTRLFPSAGAVARLDPSTLPMPRRRAETLVTLARALADGTVDLSPGADRDAAVAALAALPGIGPWTLSSVAMRALGDPDAFLPTDLGVMQAARGLGLATPRLLTAHAERWRPWRSYATQVLWGALDHPINRLPDAPQGRGQLDGRPRARVSRPAMRTVPAR